MAYDVLWRVHAVLMVVSVVSMLSGIIISIVFKKKKWRYKTHKRLGITAGASGVTAVIIAVIMVQLFSGIHFSSLHTILGGATGLLLIYTPIAGLNIARVKNKKRLKTVHRIAGFLTAGLMLVTLFTGLWMMGII